MKEEIKIFLFILSLVYTLKFVFEFGLKLFQEDPEPMTIKEIEKSLLYFSVAYIITYFLI